MKLVLVDNLILPDEGSLATLDVHPHLGLLALAAAAEMQGHEVEIVDPKHLVRNGRLRYDEAVYESFAGLLLARSPEAVGFTALGCSFLFAASVAEVLKRREPELPLLLGGPHASLLDRAILERYPQFDVIARHESDRIIGPLLDALPARRFEPIPGLTWRERSALRRTEGKPIVDDLDSLPLLDYDHYPIADLALDLLRIEAGRGCPFACTFCSTAGFFQRSYRLKSAARLVHELDRLHERYGQHNFKLDHDLFTVNRRKVAEFCAAVRGRGYRWRASARIDCVDEALLEAMADAGCVHLYFGIETGSARMQRICAKRLDLALVEPTLRRAERLGIESTASFITGYPEETQADLDDTLDLIGRLHRPHCLTQLHLLAPEPGTPLFDRHRHELRFDGVSGPYNTELLSEADRTCVVADAEVFSTYHHYSGVLPRERHRFAADAAATLRRLGPIVLGYLLRGFDRRLSRLVNDWRSLDMRADDEGLLAFLGRRFGAAHHLLSLARYALVVHDGRGECGDPVSQARPAPPFDPASRYRLHDGVRLLVELHDCEQVLAAVRASAPEASLLDDSRFSDRRSYLIHAGGAANRCWTLDAGAAAILELFDVPRRLADVESWIAEATGGAALDESFFVAMAREHVLVTAVNSPAEALAQ